MCSCVACLSPIHRLYCRLATEYKTQPQESAERKNVDCLRTDVVESSLYRVETENDRIELLLSRFPKRRKSYNLALNKQKSFTAEILACQNHLLFSFVSSKMMFKNMNKRTDFLLITSLVIPKRAWPDALQKLSVHIRPEIRFAFYLLCLVVMGDKVVWNLNPFSAANSFIRCYGQVFAITSHRFW